jgi:hypothetical protein
MEKEQYENLINLFKSVLEFYADEENYLLNKDKDGVITIDGGEQARMVLKQYNSIVKNNEEQLDEYEKFIQENKELNGEYGEDISKIIENLKNNLK